MTETKQAVYTLIGDIVGSRQAADRPSLQKTLRSLLRRMNKELKPALRFEPTIGDEFQGGFDSAADAVRASLLVRLEFFESAEVDTRFGLGHGPITVFSARKPVSQDGPGWWSARRGIDVAKQMAEVSSTSFVRTYFEPGPDDDEDVLAVAASLNAFLFCRDAMIDRMNAQGRRRLYGLMRGWPQWKIAKEEEKTQGAISQSLSRSGAYAIQAAQARLEDGLK
jgi:hypothetical protein